MIYRIFSPRNLSRKTQIREEPKIPKIKNAKIAKIYAENKDRKVKKLESLSNGVRYTIKNLPHEAAATAIEAFICKARFCLR